MELFKLFGTIAINNSEANKALEETSDKGNHAESKLSSAFKKIGAAVATYLTVDAVVNFGKGCITAAADANAMASQFSQVFGDLEGSASKSLTKIANNAGITENRMKGSFTQIAAFAKTTGMDTESALALSERAMIAVADSAAFYDRSLEETTESLQSFLKGNFENDAALGLSCTEVTRNEAANRLYGKSFKDLSEAQKQLTLLQMVEDANALSGALGQAARESDTWTNVTGTNVLDSAVGVVKKLVGVIEDCTAKVPEVVAWFGELKTKAEDLSQGALSWLSDKIAAARDGFEQVADFAKRLWDNLEPLVTLIRDNLVSAFQGLSEPMGKIKEAFQHLQPVFEKVAVVLGGALAAAIGVAIGAFNGIVSAIEGFVTLISGVAQIVSGCIQAIVGVFTGDGAMIEQAAQDIGEGVIAVFSGLWDAVSGFVEGFVDGVVGFFTGLWDTLVGHSIVPDTIDGIVNCFGELWDRVSGIVSDFCSNVVSKFTKLWESVKQATKKFLDTAKTVISSGLQNAKSTISNILSSIKNNFVNIWENCKSTVKNAVSAVKSTISAGMDGAKSAISSVLDGIKSKFTSIWDNCTSIVKNAVTALKNALNFSWSLPKLKLPHISVTGGVAPYGIGGKGSLPKFSIEWYKKAYDKAMVLSDPTIFGYNPATGKAMGGGDGNGNEIVSGESHLMNLIGNVVEGKTAEQNERIIAVLVAILEAITGGNKELLRALLAGQVIKLNEREVGRTVREYA